MSRDPGREGAAEGTKPPTCGIFDPAAWPKKLNLGCGFDRREGFLNVDMYALHNPDLVADIRKLGMLPARYYDEILAQDVLEHLPRMQTRQILAHWNRLLRIGGTIVIRVPSVLGIAKLLARSDYAHPDRQEELMQCLFGTQAYTGDFHLTSFTEILLKHYLEGAGFKLRRVEILHEWLFDVTAEKVVHIDGPPVLDYRELLEYRDDGEFVHNTYRQILEREPDPGGLDYFLMGLRTGTLSRANVIELVLASPEYKLKQGG